MQLAGAALLEGNAMLPWVISNWSSPSPLRAGSPLSIRPIRANDGWPSWAAAGNSRLSSGANHSQVMVHLSRVKPSRAAGSSKMKHPFLPNSAFDPGHVPVSDPLSHHHHSAGRPPLCAPPGPCRSMLALGPSGPPTHRGMQGVRVLGHVSKAQDMNS